MDNENVIGKKNVTEKTIHPFSGGKALLLLLLDMLCSIAAVVLAGILLATEVYEIGIPLLVLGCVAFIMFFVLICVLHIVKPNEALVLTLFGRYYGTVKEEGFYYVNPFATAFNPSARSFAVSASASGVSGTISTGSDTGKKISLKTLTLQNEKQKVNDVLGNPIIIGAVVIWKVVDPTKAVFEVENYKTYLSIQCDSTIRNIARLYPYDTMEEDSDEKTLRGSSQEIANSMKVELQQRVEGAGLMIEEVRITHLSYSEEIAAAMLQRQQAVAIIAARQKIVEGAVSMVKMAIDQ